MAIPNLAVMFSSLYDINCLLTRDCSRYFSLLWFLLIKLIYRWNHIDHSANTPVFTALRLGRLDVVVSLLNSNTIDFKIKDNEGWSLLFRLISFGNSGNTVKC